MKRDVFPRVAGDRCILREQFRDAQEVQDRGWIIEGAVTFPGNGARFTRTAGQKIWRSVTASSSLNVSEFSAHAAFTPLWDINDANSYAFWDQDPNAGYLTIAMWADLFACSPPGQPYKVSTTAAATRAVWRQYARNYLSYSIKNGEQRMWLNGVQIGTGSTGAIMPSSANVTARRLNVGCGGSATGYGTVFLGTIHLIEWYDCTLTVTDHARMMASDDMTQVWGTGGWSPDMLGAKRRASLVASTGVVLNGANVQTWGDQIALLPFSQATPGQQPLYVANATNGLPGVQFDGADDNLVATSGGLTGNAPHSIVLVCRVDGPASAFGYDGFATFSSGAGGGISSSTIGVERVGADTVHWYGGHTDAASLGSTVSSTPTGFMVLSKRFDGSVVTARKNGIIDFTSAAGYVYNLANDDMVLGAYLGGPTGPGKVTICEAHFCDALSDADLVRFERHLGAKYNIGVA